MELVEAILWALSVLVAFGLGGVIGILWALKKGMNLAQHGAEVAKSMAKGMGGGGGHMNLMDLAGVVLQNIDLKKLLGGLMGGGKGGP